MKEALVVKIGGSLITQKSSQEPQIDKQSLERICSEIADAYSQIKDRCNLFLVHGAGSFGHVIVKKSGIDSGVRDEQQMIAFAKTQELTNSLNCMVVDELISKGVPAFPFQCSSHAVMNGCRLEMMFSGAAEGLVEMGMVPVAFGVPAYDMQQKCSILSGDSIAPFFAMTLHAGKIIHATDVDGVFSADPKKDAGASLIKEVNAQNIEEVKKSLSGSSATDVTGGMLNKVMQLSDLSRLGIESVIINGRAHGRIMSAMTGGTVEGTVIRI